MSPVLDLGPEKPKPGNLADANAISNAFTKVESVVNALDDSNFASGTPIDPSSIGSGGAAVGDVLVWSGSAWIPGGGVPPGSVFPFVSGTPPSGYFICDGTTKPKASYGALYNALKSGGASSPWGEDANNFALPNLKGRIPVGLDTGQTEFNTLGMGSAPGAAGGAKGEKAHQLTIPEMPTHNHTDQGIWINLQPTGVGGNTLQRGGVSQGLPAVNDTGGNGTHNNLQPYVVINYIIKY